MATPINFNEFSDSHQKQNALKIILQGGNPADEKAQISRYPDLNVGDAPSDVEVGDKWRDSKGNIWEQKNGYKIKHGRSEKRRGGVPLLCPNCGIVMSKRLDNKMYMVHQMCFDCVIEAEDQIRKNGNWELYEKKKIAANLESWIRDQVSQFEEFLKAGDREEFVKDEFGNIEKWDAKLNLDQIKEDFDEYISIYKSKLTTMKKDISELEDG